jgi:hypothetical protein
VSSFGVTVTYRKLSLHSPSLVLILVPILLGQTLSAMPPLELPSTLVKAHLSSQMC